MHLWYSIYSILHLLRHVFIYIILLFSHFDYYFNKRLLDLQRQHITNIQDILSNGLGLCTW